jgi:hypothetical protein
MFCSILGNSQLARKYARIDAWYRRRASSGERAREEQHGGRTRARSLEGRKPKETGAETRNPATSSIRIPERDALMSSTCAASSLGLKRSYVVECDILDVSTRIISSENTVEAKTLANLGIRFSADVDARVSSSVAEPSSAPQDLIQRTSLFADVAWVRAHHSPSTSSCLSTDTSRAPPASAAAAITTTTMSDTTRSRRRRQRPARRARSPSSSRRSSTMARPRSRPAAAPRSCPRPCLLSRAPSVTLGLPTPRFLRMSTRSCPSIDHP